MEEGPEVGRREDNQEAEPLEEEPSPTFEPLGEPSPPFEPLEDPSPTSEPMEEPSPTVEPVEGEREEPPDLEGPQMSAKPPAPEGPQNSEDGEYLWDEPLLPILNKLQEMEEEDERNRATGGGLVRALGWVAPQKIEPPR